MHAASCWSFQQPRCDRSPVPIHRHIFPTPPKGEDQHGRTRGSVLLRPAKCAKRASMLAGCTRGITQQACRYGGQHRLRAPHWQCCFASSHTHRKGISLSHLCFLVLIIRLLFSSLIIVFGIAEHRNDWHRALPCRGHG